MCFAVTVMCKLFPRIFQGNKLGTQLTCLCFCWFLLSLSWHANVEHLKRTFFIQLQNNSPSEAANRHIMA